MISEKGFLKETPAMKLLITVFEQGLTGILYLKKEDVLKVLYFNRGKLIWAISNSDEDKLENILIARELVDRNMLIKVKREAHVSETIGKLLVGKGLITLEELIDTSKAQLKRIIISILKWKDGGFQFVKDAPPEKLLSLDLNITDFIVDFILDEMEISEIWKAIGSLQVEFIKNPDEQKITKYHLSDKQLELLNSFSGENKLEGILSRYSGGHRESLLKIIYFFLMTELLIKKEFDLSDSSVFEEENAFDFFQSDTSATDSKPAQPAAEPPKEQPGQTGQNYVFGDNDKHVDTAGLQTPQPAQSAPVKADATAVPPPGFIREAGIGDKKTKKIKVFNLILVVMILVVGGIILLILPVMLNEDPIAKVIKNPDTVELKDNGDIITIEEQKPAVQTEDNSDGTPGKNGDKETGKPGTETLEKTAIQKPGLKPTVKEPAQKKTEPKKKEELKKKEVKPVLKPGKSAMAYFGEGSMITAADIWKRELKREKIKFSVLLELDCLKESVVNAYSRMTVKSGFFILPRASRGRTCFLVMWGKFHSKADAAKGLKSIPQYFWQQQNPPEVVDVTKYL